MTLHPDILRQFIVYRIAPVPEAARGLADGARAGAIYTDPASHHDYEPTAADWHRLYTVEMVARDPARYGLDPDWPTYGDDEKLYVSVYERLTRENPSWTKTRLYAEVADEVNRGFADSAGEKSTNRQREKDQKRYSEARDCRVP